MSVLRLLSGKRIAWSPYHIPRSVLKDWRVAADHASALLMTDDSATGRISSWKDRIAGLAMTAATTARPLYDASVFADAHPGITADGVANVMTSSGTGNLPVGTDPCVVGALVSGFTAGRIITWGGVSSAAARRLYVDPNGLGVSFNVNGGPQQAQAAAFPNLVNPSIIIGIATGIGTASPLISLRINGEEVASYTGALAGTTGTTRARLFANTANTAADFGAGVIAETFVATTLSDADILRFEGYFKHAYPLANISLPEAHPYARRAP